MQRAQQHHADLRQRSLRCCGRVGCLQKWVSDFGLVLGLVDRHLICPSFTHRSHGVSGLRPYPHTHSGKHMRECPLATNNHVPELWCRDVPPSWFTPSTLFSMASRWTHAYLLRMSWEAPWWKSVPRLQNLSRITGLVELSRMH